MTHDNGAYVQSMWQADFVCKTCGWTWFAFGITPEKCFAQFDHTCTGPKDPILNAR